MNNNSKQKPVPRAVPGDLQLARVTPTWSDQTVPDGLRSEHSTSAWARLVVETGSVEFVEVGTNYEAIATPSDPVTIVPFAKHFIKPDEGAQFAIEFYK